MDPLLAGAAENIPEWSVSVLREFALKGGASEGRAELLKDGASR